MGGNVTDRFGAADEQMAMSFEWLPDVTANEGEKSTKSPAVPPKLTARKLQIGFDSLSVCGRTSVLLILNGWIHRSIRFETIST